MAKDGDVWRDPSPGIGFNSRLRQHPNEKPESLMCKLVKLCTVAGETIGDPYMGSGTTGVAAVRLGRNFIGIERDAAHYKTACDRIAHELDGALL
jgi:DNA modification methylase